LRELSELFCEETRVIGILGASVSA
jgi:hypothetical protein